VLSITVPVRAEVAPMSLGTTTATTALSRGN